MEISGRLWIELEHFFKLKANKLTKKKRKKKTNIKNTEQKKKRFFYNTILQLQTARCQMSIKVNSTPIYFRETFFDKFLCILYCLQQCSRLSAQQVRRRSLNCVKVKIEHAD